MCVSGALFGLKSVNYTLCPEIQPTAQVLILCSVITWKCNGIILYYMSL